jgi:hypothetical protein
MTSSEIMDDLSEKRTLAASPGIKIQDLYYSALNSTGSLVESTTNYGRLQISLSQSGWGQSAQVVVPASSFNSGVYLRLVLPNLPAGILLNRGWGYLAVANLQWTFGSSNIGSINLPRTGLIAQVMSECDTSERASELWNLAGQETLGPTTTPPTATVFLPFPWSSFCGMNPKKGFDTNLLQHSSPINFILSFSQPTEVFGGSGVALGTYPASFSAAQVLFMQTEMSNRNNGLGEILKRESGLIASYPFVHRQLFAPNIFNGSTVPATPVSAVLQSFINADLIGISFVVIAVSDLTSTTGNVPNWRPANLQNVSLTYNGIVLYNSPEFTYKMYNMRGIPGAGYFAESVVSTAVGGFPPYSVTEINAYIPLYAAAMEGKKGICDPTHMANVSRYPNQQLNLSFTTPDTSAYLLQVVYHYTALVEVNSMGSVSVLFG